jgi:NitT/TauT family transport system substrate-binding protein
MLILVVLLLSLLAACGGREDAGLETAVLTHIRLPMGYIPDPQYAPIYMAVDKGYFAEEGIEIEFDYSFETDGMALVGANELPFALVGGDQVILARAQGVPVVYVMEWFQKYPIAVVSKEAAGIVTPADLVGRNVGLPGFFGTSYVGYAGLLFANGLEMADVNANDIGFNQIESLLADQSEAVVVFANNELVQLQARGEAINVINVADYIDMVSNGLITNERTIAENPELVQRFVRAMVRGLSDTIADPAEGYEISKKYVEGLDDSRMGVLTASIAIWEADVLGYTDPRSWDRTQEILLQMGLLDVPVENLEQAYTNEFILKIADE